MNFEILFVVCILCIYVVVVVVLSTLPKPGPTESSMVISTSSPTVPSIAVLFDEQRITPMNVVVSESKVRIHVNTQYQSYQYMAVSWTGGQTTLYDRKGLPASLPDCEVPDETFSCYAVVRYDPAGSVDLVVDFGMWDSKFNNYSSNTSVISSIAFTENYIYVVGSSQMGISSRFVPRSETSFPSDFPNGPVAYCFKYSSAWEYIETMTVTQTGLMDGIVASGTVAAFEDSVVMSVYGWGNSCNEWMFSDPSYTPTNESTVMPGGIQCDGDQAFLAHWKNGTLVGVWRTKSFIPHVMGSILPVNAYLGLGNTLMIVGNYISEGSYDSYGPDMYNEHGFMVLGDFTLSNSPVPEVIQANATWPNRLSLVYLAAYTFSETFQFSALTKLYVNTLFPSVSVFGSKVAVSCRTFSDFVRVHDFNENVAASRVSTGNGIFTFVAVYDYMELSLDFWTSVKSVSDIAIEDIDYFYDDHHIYLSLAMYAAKAGIVNLGEIETSSEDPIEFANFPYLPHERNLVFDDETGVMRISVSYVLYKANWNVRHAGTYMWNATRNESLYTDPLAWDRSRFARIGTSLYLVSSALEQRVDGLQVDYGGSSVLSFPIYNGLLMIDPSYKTPHGFAPYSATESTADIPVRYTTSDGLVQYMVVSRINDEARPVYDRGTRNVSDHTLPSCDSVDLQFQCYSIIRFDSNGKVNSVVDYGLWDVTTNPVTSMGFTNDRIVILGWGSPTMIPHTEIEFGIEGPVAFIFQYSKSDWTYISTTTISQINSVSPLVYTGSVAVSGDKVVASVWGSSESCDKWSFSDPSDIPTNVSTSMPDGIECSGDQSFLVYYKNDVLMGVSRSTTDIHQEEVSMNVANVYFGSLDTLIVVGTYVSTGDFGYDIFDESGWLALGDFTKGSSPVAEIVRSNVTWPNYMFMSYTAVYLNINDQFVFASIAKLYVNSFLPAVSVVGSKIVLGVQSYTGYVAAFDFDGQRVAFRQYPGEGIFVFVIGYDYIDLTVDFWTTIMGMSDVIMDDVMFTSGSMLTITASIKTSMSVEVGMLETPNEIPSDLVMFPYSSIVRDFSFNDMNEDESLLRVTKVLFSCLIEGSNITDVATTSWTTLMDFPTYLETFAKNRAWISKVGSSVFVAGSNEAQVVNNVYMNTAGENPGSVVLSPGVLMIDADFRG